MCEISHAARVPAKLYIMRHGRTDWNDQRRLQGQTDIPLNAEGRRMAEAARETYRETVFDICFCSPLSRARETAEIFLAGRDIPIIPDDRLKEMGFGIYEGAENTLLNPDSPVGRFFSAPGEYKNPPGGAESMDSLFARTGAFLRERVTPLLAAGKRVLIVGHGGTNSSICCQCRNLPRSEFWSAGLENCKLMELI